MLKNSDESRRALPVRDPKASKLLLRTMTFIQKQITELENQLNQTTAKEFKSQLESLTSIKGIGPVIATSLIMSTEGFTLFSSAKKYSKYIGVCPS